MKLVSIVVPVLNEAENIPIFYKSIYPILESQKDKYLFEIIFTDNHSSDNTYDQVLALTKSDNRISVIRFSKNFGYQKSILTGYLYAKGDAVIQIDCDLQDPPLLILSFLEYWEKGFSVVYGIRIQRQENILINIIRKIFYRLINLLSEEDIPLDAGDFRLVDRKIIDLLRNLNDSRPYLRGTIANFGFDQVGIPYSRESRIFGKSNFRFMDLVNLGLDGILNHSVVPLRLASFFCLAVTFFTILLIIFYIVGKILFGLTWPAGFTTIIVAVLFGLSINALFLGILGEYVGRIYLQVKRGPMTIIEKSHISLVKKDEK